jgi:uncharacterized protein YdeI (YjbR/CyaY-like superfamily)
MKAMKRFAATDRSTWRSWLAANYASEREVWVVFQKKHTGQICLSYEDSVEEALCFGWIDSTVRRLDDDSYARKFTPRIDNANWSESNKRRVAKCIKDGRMTAIGLAKVAYANPENYQAPAKLSANPAKPIAVAIPSFLSKALRADATVWKNFNSLPPSHQCSYIGWITQAKREETQERRLNEAIRMLAENKRLGLK